MGVGELGEGPAEGARRVLRGVADVERITARVALLQDDIALAVAGAAAG